MKARASIKDISSYQCLNPKTKFFLDTNVLYWYTYPRTNTLNQHAQKYYSFVDSLTEAGNPLLTSVYNLSELLNVSEKTEYDIYIKLHPDENFISRKDFRRMPSERASLMNIMKTTLSNVYNICDVVQFPFERSVLDDFVNNLTTHRCDVFDYLILQNCLEKENFNIITDDNDFASIEGITLYTVNTATLDDIKF